MKAATKRPGRNTGMSLRGPTGLNGIMLKWATYGDGSAAPVVCGYWTDAAGVQRQNSASLRANALPDAVRHCLAPRRLAGFPVPSVNRAVLAIEAIPEVLDFLLRRG